MMTTVEAALLLWFLASRFPGLIRCLLPQPVPTVKLRQLHRAIDVWGNDA